MESRAPHSDHPFLLERLQPGEFEELTFLLARLDDSRVIRMKAPDGGLDTVLPAPKDASRAERGWQAKRHTGSIDWDDCEKSLERAVNVWKVRHVTFTFPRDLHEGEHKTFVARLGKKFVGVTVDYSNGSEICARLLDDERGKQIARRFFREWDPVEAMKRALRETSEPSEEAPPDDGPYDAQDVVERELTLDEFVQSQDPHFAWVVHKQLADQPDPPLAPGGIMRVYITRDDHVLIADAVPRGAAALEHGPKITVIPEDTPEGREAGRLMGNLHRGGRLRLADGVRVKFEDLPKPFGDLLPAPEGGEITIRAVGRPMPWYARLITEGDFGRHEFDLDMMPGEPPEEWDAMLEGTRAGLTITILFRWSVNDGRGEMVWNFRWNHSGAPVAERADALAIVIGLHGPGNLRVVDRAGTREPLVRPLERVAIADHVVLLHRLLDSVAEIERFTGRTLPPVPDEIPGPHASEIEGLAEALRQGGFMATMDSWKATMGSRRVSLFRRTGSDIEVRERMLARIFGHEVPIAERVIRLPLMTVRHATYVGPGDLWEVDLVPMHTDELEAWVELHPLPAEESPAPLGQ